MGGTCDEAMPGETAKELMDKGHDHVAGCSDDEHKHMMEMMQNMSEDEKKEWEKKFHKTWDSIPEE